MEFTLDTEPINKNRNKQYILDLYGNYILIVLNNM